MWEAEIPHIDLTADHKKSRISVDKSYMFRCYPPRLLLTAKELQCTEPTLPLLLAVQDLHHTL